MEGKVNTFFSYIGLVFILFFSLTITSASEEHNSLHEKLKGDWVSDYFEDWMHETVLLLSFREEKCLFITPSRNLKSYRIANDTLIVTEVNEHSRRSNESQIIHSYYKILSLTEDKLLLKVILDQAKVFGERLKHLKAIDLVLFNIVIKVQN